MRYLCSKFNYKVSSGDIGETFLFNCLKASMVRLPEGFSLLLDNISDENPLYVDEDAIEEAAFTALVEGGFLIPEDFDELKVIEDRFNNPSPDGTFSITIAPTLDCNLSCYYCYQERAKHKMDKELCDKIVFEMKRRLTEESHKRLLVDWYGGEPLLALDVIEYLSKEFINLTSELDIDYAATMVTNGTMLSERYVECLSSLKVNNIQITLDGPPEIHNKNRPFKGGKPSFDTILEGIKTAAKKFDLLIRINVNKETINQAFQTLDILTDNNVFRVGRKILPYISMIGPLSLKCDCLIQKTIELKDFYSYVLDFQKEVLRKIPNLEVEEVIEIPQPLNRACGAQNPNSFCISPTGQVFKCGLEIHELTLGSSFIWEDYSNHINWKKWMDLNPLKIENCASCNFLPLCMGGCIRYNFENNHFYKGESCSHWNNYLGLILKLIIEFKKKRNNKQQAATC